MRLREYLALQNVDMGPFAVAVGVTRESIRRYAAGERVPRPATMHAIVKATNGRVKIEDLVGSVDSVRQVAPKDVFWPPGTRLRVEHTTDGVLLRSLTAAFRPTRPDDVFGCLSGAVRSKSIKDMETGIKAEVKRRHARGRY